MRYIIKGDVIVVFIRVGYGREDWSFARFCSYNVRSLILTATPPDMSQYLENSMFQPSQSDHASNLDRDDAMQPSEKRFRATYDCAFKAWAHLHHLVGDGRQLPCYFSSPQEAFHQYPPFPHIRSLQHYKHETFISASSSWGSKVHTCKYELPPFELQVQIGVTAREPIPVFVPCAAQDKASYASWFASNKKYVPVLILA